MPKASFEQSRLIRCLIASKGQSLHVCQVGMQVRTQKHGHDRGCKANMAKLYATDLMIFYTNIWLVGEQRLCCLSIIHGEGKHQGGRSLHNTINCYAMQVQ